MRIRNSRKEFMSFHVRNGLAFFGYGSSSCQDCISQKESYVITEQLEEQQKGFLLGIFNPVLITKSSGRGNLSKSSFPLHLTVFFFFPHFKNKLSFTWLNILCIRRSSNVFIMSPACFFHAESDYEGDSCCSVWQNFDSIVEKTLRLKRYIAILPQILTSQRILNRSIAEITVT